MMIQIGEDDNTLLPELTPEQFDKCLRLSEAVHKRGLTSPMVSEIGTAMRIGIAEGIKRAQSGGLR